MGRNKVSSHNPAVIVRQITTNKNSVKVARTEEDARGLGIPSGCGGGGRGLGGGPAGGPVPGMLTRG